MGANWATAIDIIVSPAEAFRRLRERPRFLVPLLTLAVLNAGIVFWFYQEVDLAWMIEQQMPDALPAGQPPEALASGAARTVAGTLATLAAAASIVIGLVLVAAYFAFVSMLTNDGFKFKSWFSLVGWCSLPNVLSQLASGVNLLVSDASRMLPQQLNPLSFGNLLGTEAGPGMSQQFVMSLTPIFLWVLVLLILGYHSWTRRSVLKAAAIVLGPFGVVAGLIVLLS